MTTHAAYEVHITDGGSPPRPYGWEVRRVNSVMIMCSTTTFATRGEAIADSTRAARSLGLLENRPEQAV